MRAPGRLTAAIEILADILDRHRPASAALADWGKSHRFAGAGDRSAIGNLVYDALRRRASCSHLMGSDRPRALALGALRLSWGLAGGAIEALCDEAEHGPSPLEETEKAALDRSIGTDAPANVRADVPDWVMASLLRAFDENAVAEGAALAARAPIDLRANTLKAGRDKVMGELDRFGAKPTPWSPVGLRIDAASGSGRNPNVEVEASHAKGWFEVQDEGSQIVAQLAGAKPGNLVADICAGAGGKTLALAACMENKGQIFAYDNDRTRLRPIFDRLQRAGVRNAQVLRGGDRSALAALERRMDLVFVDAPCSGSGAWRRRPDTKWRLKAKNLAERVDQQRAVLVEAVRLLRPGGRLVYVTCSVLPEENTEQAEWLSAQMPELAPLSYRDLWQAGLEGEPPRSADGQESTLLLTPRSHGTDGFFFAAWTLSAN